jgi:two-component system sensor histidine kinase KdpD
MSDDRPDPDALLAKVQEEEARRERGKLRIYFGAAPGVGKTYSMLEAARKAAKEGADVLVGYIEPHVRPETQALVLGLDVLARREIAYRGTKLVDFDLEAALARKPQLILVDELAHTNAPGLTHAKRWQDVLELLEAGIDVYTTLNVQHLESVNDIVARITGVTVRETVPDSVFERADEVELVDLAPDDLIDRLREGKVYVPQQAQRAVQNFFQKGNLIALRELALRKVAERVDAQMASYRREHKIEGTWAVSERLLVCVGPSPMSPRLVRATRRLATGLRAPWIAAHVESLSAPQLSQADQDRLNRTLVLASQLGGETVTLSGANAAEEIVRYARDHNVTRIIVGKSLKPRWKELLRGSLVYELTRRSGDIDVYVTSGDIEEGQEPPPAAERPPEALAAYAYTVAIIAMCTAVGWLMFRRFAPANIVMVYLVGIVAVSLRYGRGPSILGSVLGVAAFDFCFVPPYFNFAVSDTEYLFTFAVMLATGLIISTLTLRVKAHAEAARQRERRTAALYAMSRELAALQTPQAILQAARQHLEGSIGAQANFWLPDENGRLTVLPDGEFVERKEGVAQWVFEHGKIAGFGTQTLPGADALYLPLVGTRGAVGVLGVQRRPGDTLRAPEQLSLLETLAGLIALALERAELAEQAEQGRIQIETERLRNSLLSTVSHDLRTPLASIAGASSTLVERDDSLSRAARRELAESIFDETERLNRLVANLLDTTRLEGGAMTIKKEWQPLEEIVGVVLNRLTRPLRDYRVVTNLPPDLPLLPFDDVLIQQVLINLLENAIKFSQSGSTIELSVEAAPGIVTVTVADEGPGFPPQALVRVFDKFYRIDRQTGRAGTGLGLSICRGIVELHGGRIWAKNRPGGGAEIHFTLPIVGEPPLMPAGELQAPLATETR